MLIMSLGCLQFSRESCLLYAFLLGYLPSIFCDFGEKPIDFYLQDSFTHYNQAADHRQGSGHSEGSRSSRRCSLRQGQHCNAGRDSATSF